MKCLIIILYMNKNCKHLIMSSTNTTIINKPKEAMLIALIKQYDYEFRDIILEWEDDIWKTPEQHQLAIALREYLVESGQMDPPKGG
jgi:hypothetical protein